MVTISATAAKKIEELLQDSGDPLLKLRIYVQGGGCSGFQYGFMFDSTVAHDDHLITSESVDVIVDSMSLQYLLGSTLEYHDDLTGSSFSVVNNPNAQTTCGCGSSFSI